MTNRPLAAVALVATAVFACGRGAPGTSTTPASVWISLAPGAGETHLRNIHQITNGGENAEAYFSADGRLLIFQSTRDGRSCDQEYIMRADGGDVRRVSNGTGKTTCGYFFD